MAIKEMKAKTVNLSELADAAGNPRLVLPQSGMSRRSVLRGSGGIILLAALPTAPMLSGCWPDSWDVDDILNAIKAAKEIFDILEKIGGTIAAINKGDEPQDINVKLELLEELSQPPTATGTPGASGARAGRSVASNIVRVSIPPSRNGEASLIPWSGFQASRVGPHFASARALRKLVESSTFRVEG
ncbi:hypothetical protein [Myxococcus stipitatus]|uniref:hypothetical protein n=1 Tax=Myxococcus stipitatus TaxID=83455 RepID=UPI0030D4F5D5